MTDLTVPDYLAPVPPINAADVGFATIGTVQPFSPRVGIGYQDLLESLRVYIQNDLYNFLTASDPTGIWNANVDKLLAAVGDAITEAQAGIDSALAAQKAEVAQNLAGTLAQIVSGTNADLYDAQIYAGLEAANSTALALLDGRYAPQSIVATVTQNATDVARLKARLAELFFNVKDYGATGNGVTDDTAAVQSAITAALAASDPANSQSPIYTGSSPTVYFPLGTYKVGVLTVPGTLRIVGQETYAYASATLLQRTVGQSAILFLDKDTDNQSNASVIESLTFRSVSGTSDPASAQIKTASGIQSNSIYIRKCWFATPERYAIWITQGDDIRIEDCTFDVIPFNAIQLGTDATHICTNVAITGNDFYKVGVSCIQATSVNGLLVSNNRAFGDLAAHPSSMFLDETGATDARGWLVAGNLVRYMGTFAHIVAGQGLAFNDNSLDHVDTQPFYFGGGAVLYAISVNGNNIVTSGSLAHGAFYAESTGLQVCSIQNNTILAGGTSALMFDMADSRVTGNMFKNNPSLRFSANNNFANAAANTA